MTDRMYSCTAQIIKKKSGKLDNCNKFSKLKLKYEEQKNII